MTYISQSHTWVDPTPSTEDVVTAAKLNGNNDDFIDGLKDGTKDINCNQITAALTGNSDTSTTITSRNLNLTGNLLGSDAFDGSADIEFIADNVSRPIASAGISYGWSKANQAIMDAKGATNSSDYNIFTHHWNVILYFCMKNDVTNVNTLITYYNIAFPGDPITSGERATIVSKLGSTKNDFSNFVTLETTYHNIQVHSAPYYLKFEESPNRLTSWWSLDLYQAESSQRYQIITTSMCAAGCIHDGVSALQHIQEKDIRSCTSTFDEGALPTIEINFPLKYPTNFVAVGGVAVTDYIDFFDVPYLVNIMVYKT